MTSPLSDLGFVRSDEGISFWIHVTPRARREGLGGVRGDALRIAVNAPPSDGAANRACVELLAKSLGVARGRVELPAGTKNRRKRVRVYGDPDILATRLMELAAEKGS